jgi:hypothetical protein
MLKRMMRSPQFNCRRNNVSRSARATMTSTTDERNCNPRHLNEGNTVTKDQRTGRDDENRRQRIEHRNIRSAGILQPYILQGAE